MGTQEGAPHSHVGNAQKTVGSLGAGGSGPRGGRGREMDGPERPQFCSSEEWGAARVPSS